MPRGHTVGVGEEARMPVQKLFVTHVDLGIAVCTRARAVCGAFLRHPLEIHVSTAPGLAARDKPTANDAIRSVPHQVKIWMRACVERHKQT